MNDGNGRDRRSREGIPLQPGEPFVAAGPTVFTVAMPSGMEGLLKENERLRKRVEELEGEVGRLEGEVERLRQDVRTKDKVHADEVDELREKLRAEKRKWSDELDSVKEENASLRGSVRNLEIEVHTLTNSTEGKLSKLMKEIKERDDTIEKLRRENKGLKGTLEAWREKYDQEMAAAKDQRQTLEQKVRALENDVKFFRTANSYQLLERQLVQEVKCRIVFNAQENADMQLGARRDVAWSTKVRELKPFLSTGPVAEWLKERKLEPSTFITYLGKIKGNGNGVAHPDLDDVDSRDSLRADPNQARRQFCEDLYLLLDKFDEIDALKYNGNFNGWQ